MVEGSRGVTIWGDGSQEIKGITEDSREVQDGFLFASLKGTHTDGARFIRDAVARGAAGLLVQEVELGRQHSIPVVVSEEPRRTFAEISSVFFGRPSARLNVVGVTGTNGKTTTTYVLRQLLGAQGVPAGWIGTIGYALGSRFVPASHTTPSAVCLQSLLSQMLGEGQKAVAMEVSSHALDQGRVEAVDFDVAVFTNLTRDHLDYHGTLDSYLKIKTRLFELLNNSAKWERCAVVNADDPASDVIRRVVKTPLLSFGITEAADVRACHVRLSQEGTDFDLVSPMGSRRVRLPLLGRFNVSNALAAVSAALALGMDLDGIVETLHDVTAPPGRMEFLPGNHPFRVVVDYAHTDDALRNVLTTVREFTRGRVLVVFGCGGNRDRTKRPLMGKTAQELADFSFLTSDNPRGEDPRAILEEIETGFDRRHAYCVCEDRAEAIEWAVASARSGDTVVIAGKGHETVQIFKDRTVPFSDVEVARSILEKAGCGVC